MKGCFLCEAWTRLDPELTAGAVSGCLPLGTEQKGVPQPCARMHTCTRTDAHALQFALGRKGHHLKEQLRPAARDARGARAGGCVSPALRRRAVTSETQTRLLSITRQLASPARLRPRPRAHRRGRGWTCTGSAAGSRMAARRQEALTPGSRRAPAPSPRRAPPAAPREGRGACSGPAPAPAAPAAGRTRGPGLRRPPRGLRGAPRAPRRR